MNRRMAIFVGLGFLASTATLGQSIQNGGFDDTNKSFVGPKPGGIRSPPSQMAPGWSAGPGGPGLLVSTPDWDTVPGTTGTGYAASVPASSDGDHWMGMLGIDGGATGESITQQISGAVSGRTYRLEFEQIALPADTGATKMPSGALNDNGYFEVSLFGQTMKTPVMAGDGNKWILVQMDFLATSQTSRLTITARDAALGNGFRAYLGVDGVRLQLLADPIPGKCLDFSRLKPGSRYKVGKAISTTASVDIFVEKYQFPSGQWSSGGDLLVGGSGKDTAIFARHANARIMFRAPPRVVVTRFAEMRNSINLMVNGELKKDANLKTLDGTTIKGVKIAVSSHSVDFGEVGYIVLAGPIGSYAIGGEELWFDTVCAIR